MATIQDLEQKINKLENRVKELEKDVRDLEKWVVAIRNSPFVRKQT